MVTRTRLRLGLISIAGLVAIVLGVAWSFWSWSERPPQGLTDRAIIVVVPGSSVPRIATQLASAGVVDHARLFSLLVRLRGAGGRLQAGEFAFEPGMSPRHVLERLVAGDVVQHEITLIEGWTFAEALRAIRAHGAIQTTEDAEQAFRHTLPPGVSSPEGRIFPDTYRFTRGTTDLALLQLAAERLMRELTSAWSDRAPDLLLRAPDDALVLASLVEKESAVDDERPLVAAVFLNRLRIGMRLQSDPTVIYGLGSAFDGDLRRADLRRDTPYNTYTRQGLPPTPIALAGAGAIRAATRPARTDALYFVATGDGDGRHRFAATLAEHNRNVERYLAVQRRGEGG